MDCGTARTAGENGRPKSVETATGCGDGRPLEARRRGEERSGGEHEGGKREDVDIL